MYCFGSRKEKVLLPESLIWALENFEPSYVTIDCGSRDPKVVSKAFDEIFRENWENAFEQTTEEVGVPYEEDDEYYPLSAEESYPAVISEESNGLRISFSPVLIPYCYGEFCEVAIPCDTLERSLQELKNKFPEIEYKGLIAFPWSDRRCGDVEEFLVYSKPTDEKDIYNEIANVLECAVNDMTVSQKHAMCHTTFGGNLPDSFQGSLYEQLNRMGLNYFIPMVMFMEEFDNVLSEKVKTELKTVLFNAADGDAEVEEYLAKAFS